MLLLQHDLAFLFQILVKFSRHFIAADDNPAWETNGNKFLILS